MFIPSIDAMWCECLTLFYKIGFSSFSTRSIVRGLKFERNEFHDFNRVIRQVEMCRYCCCSVSVTRVICGLSVFGESFTKCHEKGLEPRLRQLIYSSNLILLFTLIEQQPLTANVGI